MYRNKVDMNVRYVGEPGHERRRKGRSRDLMTRAFKVIVIGIACRAGIPPLFVCVLKAFKMNSKLTVNYCAAVTFIGL